MKKLFLLIAGLICLLLSATAQEQPGVWNLKQCIDYALKNNIQIRQQTLTAEIEKNNLTQSKLNLLPSVNANSSYQMSTGRVPDPNNYKILTDQVLESFNFNLSGSMTVFNGFYNHRNIQYNRYNFLSNLQQLEKLKNDISLNIASAYLQILFNMQLVEIARMQFELSMKQVERTNILVEAGSVPLGNLYQIQAQHASDEVQLVNSRNNLEISYLTLKQLLDLNQSEAFSIEIPDTQAYPIDSLLVSSTDIYLKAENTMPEIKAVENQLLSSRAALGMARAQRYPKLFINGGYGSSYSVSSKDLNPNYGGQLSDNQNSYISLGLTIPIFNNWAVTTQVKNSKLTYHRTELEVSRYKLQLQKEIEQSYADALAAYKQYNATNKALQSYTELFHYAQQKYEAGAMNFMDYQQARNQYVQAESELLRSRFDYLFKMKVLDFYQGKPIVL